MEQAFFKPEVEERKKKQKIASQWMDLIIRCQGLVLTWFGVMVLLFQPHLEAAYEIDRDILFGGFLTAMGLILATRRERVD